MAFFDFFTKERKEDLDQGLQKSNEGIFDKLSKAVAGKTVVDEETLDEIEAALIASDIGVGTTVKLIEALETRVAQDKYISTNEVYEMLKDEIVSLLTENNTPDYDGFDIPFTYPYPYVMLIVGVNGVGKTTTIGKLAYQFKKSGKSVMLGAADTFRAAAVEQLTIWADRVGVPIVKQGTGADPAAVAYDTVQSAISKQIDVVLIDTAGRLHNKSQLMQELSKIKRALQKVAPPVPQDIMLVLDGSTGQNAFHQAQEFTKATEVTCLAITKLDGTAKGGVVLGIADQLKVPVKYIGVGEGVEKLQVFNKRQFVDSLFKKKKLI
jgi:fused signal recognition particle receptor